MNNMLNYKKPYPVHVLPEVAQDFTHCTVAATDSLAEAVGPVLLSAAAASMQALVDVKTPYGPFTKPTSLNVGVVIRSGKHKSVVLECFLPTIEEFEQGLLHDKAQDSEDKAPQFIIEKGTEAGVIDIFRHGTKSAFFASDEGIQMLRQLDMAAACKRYDGATIRTATQKNGSVVIPGTRSSVCLLIQDKPFSNYMKKKGDILIESGFMPRTLMSFASQPASMPAQYSILPSRHKDPKTHPFQDIIRDNLKATARSLCDPAFKRSVIALDILAETSWQCFYQWTKMMEMHDPSWESLAPFLSRAGENALRVAAVLQWIESPEPHIEKWAMDAAIEIVTWHLMEAKSEFGEPPIEVKMQQHADTLYDYLRERALIGIHNVECTRLLRYAPTSLRKADHLHLALHYLQQTNRVAIYQHSGKEYVFVRDNPRMNPSHISLGSIGAGDY
jgi:hypothetical protein